eukprot:TRINITY_DN9162_c0_g1_i1.p1 TRINITY_DN9162_c0_g1~~TRINITY_DN9162_c0_g1_i1.p1  ORF type:complete len:767 (-),score=76.92 TRINITY_DN9162_c0_g1_i1:185-2485(-)
MSTLFGRSKVNAFGAPTTLLVVTLVRLAFSVRIDDASLSLPVPGSVEELGTALDNLTALLESLHREQKELIKANAALRRQHASEPKTSLLQTVKSNQASPSESKTSWAHTDASAAAVGTEKSRARPALEKSLIGNGVSLEEHEHVVTSPSTGRVTTAALVASKSAENCFLKVSKLQRQAAVFRAKCPDIFTGSRGSKRAKSSPLGQVASDDECEGLLGTVEQLMIDTERSCPDAKAFSLASKSTTVHRQGKGRGVKRRRHVVKQLPSSSASAASVAESQRQMKPSSLSSANLNDPAHSVASNRLGRPSITEVASSVDPTCDTLSNELDRLARMMLADCSVIGTGIKSVCQDHSRKIQHTLDLLAKDCPNYNTTTIDVLRARSGGGTITPPAFAGRAHTGTLLDPHTCQGRLESAMQTLKDYQKKCPVESAPVPSLSPTQSQPLHRGQSSFAANKEKEGVGQPEIFSPRGSVNVSVEQIFGPPSFERQTAQHWANAGKSEMPSEKAIANESRVGEQITPGQRLTSRPAWVSEPNLWPKAFPDCGGNAQSPIDISIGVISVMVGEPTTLGAYLHYNVAHSPRVVTGFNAVKVNADFGHFRAPFGVYNLFEILLHFPSEHSFDGEVAEGELQLVHRRNGTTGIKDLVIMSMLLSAGAARDTSGFFGNLGLGLNALVSPLEAPSSGDLDLAVFNRQLNGNFFHYRGSLTVPPCSETVRWYVMQAKAQVLPTQIAIFKTVFQGASARPRQPLHDRLVVVDSLTVDTDYDDY